MPKMAPPSLLETTIVRSDDEAGEIVQEGQVAEVGHGGAGVGQRRSDGGAHRAVDSGGAPVGKYAHTVPGGRRGAEISHRLRRSDDQQRAVGQAAHDLSGQRR
jgi:hypothetical protein